MKLALGTAQFGLDYGIANQVGKVADDELLSILDLARKTGIDTIDTAIAYGDSETRLGHAGVAGFRIISKLPPNDASRPDIADRIKALTVESLERLGVESLECLLLHRAMDLCGSSGSALYSAMHQLKEMGLVKGIGVSIYGPDDLDAIPSDFVLDLVQAPFNAFDQRLLTSGWLSKLALAGVRVHARSLFLQGLLLMEDSQRPATFDRWDNVWREWSAWLKEKGLSRVEGALAAAANLPELERFVVGVDSAKQLADVIRAVHVSQRIGATPDFSVQDAELINPNLWRMP